MPPVSLPVGMRRKIHQLRKEKKEGKKDPHPHPRPLNKEAERGVGVRVVQLDTPTSLCLVDSLWLGRSLWTDRQVITVLESNGTSVPRSP